MDSVSKKRINMEYLVHGYSRKNCKSSILVPSSVLNVILYYYPSMNGYTFVWHLTNIQDILQSRANIIDSDVFNIGLSNKFFLRLSLNSCAVLTRAGIKTATSQNQPASGRRDRSYNSNNNNNSSWGFGSNSERKTNDVFEEETKANNLLLSLMSFPIRGTYKEQKFHCELYCHEINAQYSAIWDQQESQAKKYDDYNSTTETNRTNRTNRANRSNPVNIYFQHPWVINYDLQKYRENKLTIECKINILTFYQYQNKQQPSHYSHQRSQQDSYYKYIALPFLKGNQTKMRFTWNIIDKSILDKLTGSSNYKGIVQFHSDIFYDMFQLQIGRLNGQNYFQFQICGLPKSTAKMGVKLQLFATDMNNEANKIQIMSNIVTFSYNSPLYTLSHDKITVLIDILSQYKNISLLCIANIIDKYDTSGKIIKKDTKTVKKIEKPNDKDEINNDEINADNAPKWLKFVPHSFVWHITDTKLLKKLQSYAGTEMSFDSKVFELSNHKWYMNFRGVNNNSRRRISVNLHCITYNRKHFCTSTINILQTKEESMKSGYMQQGNIQQLYIQPIKKLNKLSIKITVGIIKINDANHIDCSSKGNDIKIWLRDTVGLPQYYPLFMQKGIDELSIVKLLPNDAIRGLRYNSKNNNNHSEDWAKGIKFGHQLKIMNEINKLKSPNKSSKGSAAIKEYRIAIISACILFVCFLKLIF